MAQPGRTLTSVVARGLRRAAPLFMLVGLASGAAAQSNPVFLQYFEAEWADIERRTPDLFLAGYGAVWLPPPSKAATFQSVGYDPFDRFDLGGPPITATGSNRARTTYGTEQSFGAMVDELQHANVLVYVDAVLNHNSQRTESDAFLAQGGWPGFWIPRESPPRNKQPTDNWGDFHAGVPGGYLQSEDPGAPRYDTLRGDLVALVDIDQSTNHRFIRQPVDPANPSNIPAGTQRNLPDPGNRRFYPDLSLDPDQFVNPASNHSGANSVIRHPFNLVDPMRGDPVMENASDLLARWSRWMMEVQGIDGFRLDASKHTFPWWWDTFFDSAVYQTRTTPDGRRVTPLSFGENTTGNFDVLANFFRRDGFGNRDSLDLNGAARLRELISAGGFGSWGPLFDAGAGHLDVAHDGFNNGSAGIFHIFSHDNGSVGDGGAFPPLPTARQQGWFAHAYMLMRPGRPLVYHHARGIPRAFGFQPREGVPIALGLDPATNQPNDTITNLVNLHNQYAFGQYYQLNGDISDVLIFERAAPFQGGLRGNVLVGVNDRYDAGWDQRSVATSFPQGKRLVELTGNAADPAVDPGGQIPEVLVVGQNGVVTMRVPRNASSAGEHNKGFVIYGPAVPQAEITIVGASGEIPADPPAVPAHRRRLNAIPIVSGDTFTLRVDTSRADPVDPIVDDNAIFRINQGTEDWNGNGVVDIPLTNPQLGGYEQFVTTREPGMDSPDLEGLYEQTIDATRLEDGFHYISVIVFRQRPSGTTPIFREVREVIYVDRTGPQIELVNPGPFTDDRPNLGIRSLDRTTRVVHTMLNLPPDADPIAEATIFNAASRWDRREWRRTFDEPLVQGPNRVTIVAFSETGTATVEDFEVFANLCAVDLAPPFGVLDIFDVLEFLTLFEAQDDRADFAPPFGVFDIFDVLEFLAQFEQGCP